MFMVIFRPQANPHMVLGKEFSRLSTALLWAELLHDNSYDIEILKGVNN